jgi:hypothetical protein
MRDRGLATARVRRFQWVGRYFLLGVRAWEMGREKAVERGDGTEGLEGLGCRAKAATVGREGRCWWIGKSSRFYVEVID